MVSKYAIQKVLTFIAKKSKVKKKMNKTLKIIGLGILAVISTVFLLGYPIIISTFFLYEVRFIIRGGLYIATGITIVSLIGLLISHIVKAIKNKIKRGDLK